MKKLITISIVMLLAFLPGCGQKSSVDEAELTRLTVMIFDRKNAPEGQTLTDNRWTEYVNEKMAAYNIKIEFIPVSRDSEYDSVNLMMNSDIAADIMLCYDRSLVQNYYPNGYTHNLASYINSPAADDLRAYIGEALLAETTLYTGEMWAIRAKRATNETYNLFIRKDWLDKLGLDIPKTTDELYNVLVAFKSLPASTSLTNQPIIPSSFLTSGLLGPLSGSFLDTISDERAFSIANTGINGAMIYSDPGFTEYMRFLNKLYNKGLMSDDFIITSDNQQMQKEYFLANRLGAYEAPVNGNVDTLRGSLLQTLQETVPDAEMVSIPPLENIYDGKQYNCGYTDGGAYIFIPLTCEHPEAAITYLNWLATDEGGKSLYHGFENEHFIYRDEVPAILDAAYNATDKDWIRHDLFLIGNQGYYRTKEDFILATSTELPGYEDYVINNYQNAGMNLVAPRNCVSYTEQVFHAQLQQLCNSHMIKIITCKPEKFDEFVEAFITDLKSAGIEQIINEQAAYYDSSYSYISDNNPTVNP